MSFFTCRYAYACVEKFSQQRASDRDREREARFYYPIAVVDVTTTFIHKRFVCTTVNRRRSATHSLMLRGNKNRNHAFTTCFFFCCTGISSAAARYIAKYNYTHTRALYISIIFLIFHYVSACLRDDVSSIAKH